ncbi:hypothetical protein SAMN05421833_15215 [Microbispora rosea]|uniref:Uncharacterized protein n=1 Tax=Microbispora rosea TaxID=58117 RepID=A0A1N7HIB3_9ACTN|nr:hypothetical protein [Microbispora rosea]SIS24562.1 hypothetical protein SAMN05421833_15215 [Microbispora rosea]
MSAATYGAVEVKREFDRPPTDSELHAASVQEIGLRWRTRSAGEIFPATVDYGSGGAKELAVRVGVAPEASCSKALDAVIAKVAVADGCRAVLRATYLDKTQTLVTTVGVAEALRQAARLNRLPARPRRASTRYGPRPASAASRTLRSRPYSGTRRS